METKFQILERVIGATNAAPTIVNEQSRFIVATYWWGRGNQNKNIARPCMKWYEDVLKLPIEVFKTAEIRLTYIFYKRTFATQQPVALATQQGGDSSAENAAYESLRAMFASNNSAERSTERRVEGLAGVITRHSSFEKGLSKLVHEYVYERKDQTATMTAEEIKTGLTTMLVDLIQRNMDKFDRLADMYNAKRLIDEELEHLKNQPDNQQALKELAKKAKHDVSDAFAAIQAAFRTSYQTQGDAVHAAFPTYFTGSTSGAPASVIASLETVFRYKSSVAFEDMIETWKTKCVQNNCNYIAVEYPEFAKPGGYQLAINAKPLFIRKMLDLAGGRGVLYIDGDMTIEQYPAIFDMPDVDYAARGWNIDPRGNESVYLSGEFTFDPYYFETSGGTMFFGNTAEAKQLLDLWSYFSARPINDGKADDRIISLLVNTKAMLGPLKVLQLPVEYLWLSMWYNDFVRKGDYQPLFIEHPECLTSEDTASGSGAASSRQPEFYDNLESIIVKPRSELMFEQVLFDAPIYADCMRKWMEYMSGIEYIYGDLEGEAPIYLSTWGSYGTYSNRFANNMVAYQYPRIHGVLSAPSTGSRERMVVEDESSVIPHIVHQIWFSRDDEGGIPTHKLAMMRAVEKAAKCAGWEYRLWTIDDLVQKQFPCVWELCVKAEEIMNATGQSRWAQIADLCRYELLNRYGGVYLDTNFLVRDGLFRAIEQRNAKGRQVIVCNEDEAGLDARGHDGQRFLSNAFLAGVRHHHIFRQLISDEMLGTIDIQSRYINRTSGPYYLRRAFDVLDDDFSEIEVLPSRVMFPIRFGEENPCLVATGANATATAAATDEVDVGNGTVLKLSCWRDTFPKALGAYMIGLGGSWDFSKLAEDEPVA